MTKVTIKLKENDYQRLKKAAKLAGKSVQVFIYERVTRLLDNFESFDITKNPVFKMEEYNSEAPANLFSNLDKYLYGEEYQK